jgi:hypothetical protein
MDASVKSVPADPQTARSVLIECYHDGAGAEALLRAFIAERNRETLCAQFWVGVYGLIVRQTVVAEQPQGPAQVCP